MKRQLAGGPKRSPSFVAASVGIRAAVLHAAALAGGMIVSAPERWPDRAALLDPIRDWDASAIRWVSAHYEPAFAPGLYAALGPSGVLYLVLICLTLLSALVCHWRRFAPAASTLLISAGIAAEVQWLTTTVFPHALLAGTLAETRVDPTWLAMWTESGLLPGRHVAITAALAGSLASTWLLMALPGVVLAIVAAAASVYAGAVWPSEAMLGLLIGLMAAAYARFLISWALPATLDLIPQLQRGDRPIVQAPVVVIGARRVAHGIGSANGRARAA